MAYMTDIEIAQSVTPAHISEVAASLNIDDKYVEQYGKTKAKIDFNYLNEIDKKNYNIILIKYIKKKN